MFPWIPIHREAIHRIVEHRENQTELAVLRGMEQQGLKIISLQDEGADGQKFPLAEIDPFTFLLMHCGEIIVEDNGFSGAIWEEFLQHPQPFKQT